MGLLDDAIREHLELKRKHGATDDDVRRQETEALGPARRDFTAGDADVTETAAAASPDEDIAPEPPVAAEPEPAAWLDEEPSRGLFDAEDETAREAPPEPLEHAAEAADAPLAEQSVPAPDPLPAAEEPPAPPRPEGDTPPQGFPALDREDETLAGDDEPPAEGEEDVLEETPDFLQDTPEHDRLWFEQKPPRDFDFDG